MCGVVMDHERFSCRRRLAAQRHHRQYSECHLCHPQHQLNFGLRPVTISHGVRILPEEELEEGSQPLIPDWPLLAHDDGCALDRDGSAFDSRLVEWRSERTSRCVRVHPKRRHHTRSRRASRERHRTQLPMLVTDWSTGEGFIRPANLSDVKLPSPPESKSALLQLRHRLLMERKLPKGCRIMPARGSKRRRIQSIEQVHDDLSKTETANGEAPALPAQPELVVPDIEINVFDDNF
jgi:hypothetical protein